MKLCRKIEPTIGLGLFHKMEDVGKVLDARYEWFNSSESFILLEETYQIGWFKLKLLTKNGIRYAQCIKNSWLNYFEKIDL